MTQDRALGEFLARPAVTVAPQLLGAVLSSTGPEGTVAVRLTEVEAYEGAGDPASHAHRGPTPRTRIMFGPPARLYVYFSYGMHWCVNLVCQDDGVAAAVLLRAGDVVAGRELAALRRPAARAARDLARGPARLAAALGLDGKDDGLDLLEPGSRVALRLGPPGGPVRSGPRVGVGAGAGAPWRFFVDGAPSVSAFRPGRSRGNPGAARQAGPADSPR